MRYVIVLATALLIVDTASAHHSAIAFDQEQVVVVEGVVTRFDWTNPHVYLFVKDADSVEWRIETDSTPILTRSSWMHDSFAPGDIVTIRANPHRVSEKVRGLLLSVERPDGASLTSLGRSSGDDEAVSTTSAPSLEGVWRGDAASTRAFIAAFSDHPLTEKGETAKAEYDETMNPGAACVPWTSPMLVASRFYLRELEVQDAAIVFRSEFYSAERTIHTDGREHPEGGERTNQGHSIGWWEGDTLVVDTRLFADHRSPITSTGVPSGALKHLIERYTLSDNGTQILIDIYLEDPEYLAEPFSGDLAWHYSPHLELLRFDCDPEVARRFAQ